MYKGLEFPEVVLAAGTRPEAIKLAAIARELEGSSLGCEIWTSGQHRELLDQTMMALGLDSDLDLGVMVPDQTLDHVLGAALGRFGAALDERPPSLVVVQGDTTTALACALAAFHRRIPIAHVEAGLRSGHTEPFRNPQDRVDCTGHVEEAADCGEGETGPASRLETSFPKPGTWTTSAS